MPRGRLWKTKLWVMFQIFFIFKMKLTTDTLLGNEDI
jgi:hypothetical protein